MSTYTETRQRMAETVATLGAGLDTLTHPQTRLDFTELTLREFVPVVDDG